MYSDIHVFLSTNLNPSSDPHIPMLNFDPHCDPTPWGSYFEQSKIYTTCMIKLVSYINLVFRRFFLLIFFGKNLTPFGAYDAASGDHDLIILKSTLLEDAFMHTSYSLFNFPANWFLRKILKNTNKFSLILNHSPFKGDLGLHLNRNESSPKSL